MRNSQSHSSVDRMPPAMDQGKSSESCINYIYDMYREHRRLKNANEPLLTDKAHIYACGFPIPYFQRDLVWSRKQEVEFIESAWLGIPLGTFNHHVMDWESGGVAIKYSGWLIDGQQRLTALERYWNDEFKVFGLLWSELNRREVRRFMAIKFPHFESELWDEDQMRELYNRLAFGGTPHKPNERA
jgi:hypothetical protein